jgi:hypothetical protein
MLEQLVDLLLTRDLARPLTVTDDIHAETPAFDWERHQAAIATK